MTSQHATTWPAGVASALCLTFDLDAETMWTSRDPASARRPSTLSQGSYDVGEGLSGVLDLLDRNGISATFFVPSDTAVRHPDAVRRIAAQGHEIACHGTDHVPLVDPSREAELDMLRRATEALEAVAGVRPTGYRAPLYSVTDATWDLLAGLGYRYSSNLMDTIHPYVHDAGVVEIPVHWSLDDGLYFLTAFHPPNYRKPSPPSQVAEIWCEELSAVAECAGLVTLTLHPQLIARPSRIRALQKVLDTALELGGVWLPRMRDVADHVHAAGRAGSGVGPAD